MTLPATHRWLVCLSDPLGAENLPEDPLRPDQLGRLIPLARAHGVLPAVAGNLQQLTGRYGPRRVIRARNEQMAEDVLDQALSPIREILRNAAGYTLLLRQQTARIAEAIQKKDLPWMVLKGAEFADRLYPDPSMRLFTDVDLLVPRETIDDVAEVLGQLGYLSRSVSMKYNTDYGERSFQPDGWPGGKVEIHWNLVNSPSLREGLNVHWEDLQTVASASSTRVVPSAASLLLIAGVHAAASHSFDRLQPLWDICLAARGAAGTIDESYLAATAQRTGSRWALAMGLHLAENLLGEVCCGQLQDRLHLPRVGPLSRRLLSPGVVLRNHAWRDSFRRQIFRRMLKRPR